MKNFIVTNAIGKKVNLNLPTHLDEIIVPDYLKDVTEIVELLPYQALVGIIYRNKILEIVNSSKKSRALATTIVPVFVKANIPNNDDYNFNKYHEIKIGNKLIIAGSDIERGYGIICPRNFITIENILRIYNSNADFAKKAITDQDYYYFLDFKVVPINDIKGFYTDVKSTFNSPFISNVDDETEN